ncbi:FAD-dependent oxidoreductase [Candidatus Woesearchaeota archaeon]|nr:FAD-dependent oxidoreductase [Candidatus Woesearchaeota archaeon]
MVRIVILGAGFGGVYAALRLQKGLRKGDSLVVVSIQKDFVFTPLLHEVSAGFLSASDVSIPLSSLLRKCQLIQGDVKSIDFNRQVVAAGSKKVPYDLLLIALGAMPNKSVLSHINIKQRRKFLQLKTVHDAKALHKRLADPHKQKSVLVIGAGATGIEAAAEAKEFFKENGFNGAKVSIVQDLPDIFLDKPASFRNYIKKSLGRQNITIFYDALLASYADDTAVIQTPEGKKKIEATVPLLAAGVIPVPVKTFPKITDEKGFFNVNQFLEVKGAKSVWAVGDISLYLNPVDKKPVPMLAQAAKDEGIFAAGNIAAKLSGKPQKAYKFHSKGFLLSLGKFDGVGNAFGIPVKGFIAWWLKRTAYAMEAPGFSNKLRMFWRLSIASLFKR